MNKLRYMRKTRSKLTMKQLGEIVGVTESAIWNYETGKREPDYEMLLKLSEALGVTVADIMEEKDEVTDTYSDLAEELQILRDREDLRSLLLVSARQKPETIRKIREMFESMEEG